MIPYSVEFHANAADDLTRLDTEPARRVRGKLDELAVNAETIRHQALTGRLRGLFRTRVGDYRILYTLDRQTRRIIVRAVAHRRDVYRNN